MTDVESLPTEGSQRDWIEVFEGPHRGTLCDQIRALPLERLQRFPPPKSGPGLPFGREGRILHRFLTGRSSMLDPSGFSRVYLSLASQHERGLFETLVLGEARSSAGWSSLIGAEALSLWRELDLFEEHGPDRLEARFRVFRAHQTTLLVDPTISQFVEGWHNRVHIGQDSLNLLEFLAPRVPARASRLLEVGPGSGLILLALAPGREQAVGLDINPRAVRVSRLNAELNQRANVRIEEADIFASGADIGRFDFVYWNTPLNFLPESAKDISVDGYGGHLGIELALDFIQRLPELLADGGRAVVAAFPPVLDSGENPLEKELATLARKLRYDMSVNVTQTSWMPDLRAFHRQFSIKHFENVFIEIAPGEGRLRRVPPGPGQRALDVLRGALYSARAHRADAAS